MSAPVSMKYGRVRNYYGGGFVESKSGDWLGVTSPLDGAALSQVPMSTSNELDAAAGSAKNAFHCWSQATITDRVQVFFGSRSLLETFSDQLTALSVEGNG